MSKVSDMINANMHRVNELRQGWGIINGWCYIAGFPSPIGDLVTGFLFNRHTYHGTKESFKKHAWETKKRWLYCIPYSNRPEGKSIDKDRIINILNLASCYWNKPIDKNGHLILKTTKNLLPRKSSRNFVRPKYHLGDSAICKNCGRKFRLVLPRTMFDVRVLDQYFKCIHCMHEYPVKEFIKDEII